MQLPIVQLPRAVPVPREREPQPNIPPTRGERERYKALAERYADTVRLVPPLTFEELRRHTDAVIARYDLDPRYRDFLAVLVNNAAWRDHLAAVPYERRLLLLPKCLRVEERCPAPFDEFGLLCKQCGLCSIQELQEEAERLGYAVLVAEGSAIVMAIIQTGKIDAIVGVSCLNVLERAFPYMEAAAIPGVAIPLLQDDCKNTSVDMEWIWDVIHLTGEDRTYRLDLDRLRAEVEGWFTPAALAETLGAPAGDAEALAHEWLARAGKRWRPFLTVCAYRALRDDPEAPLPPALRQVAVAVECFHKASLIHDDIEDDDARRYDREALHVEQGVPVALNVGDLLIGEGYRLLGEADLSGDAIAAMLRVAAAGHRTLCTGQGAELAWARAPEPLGSLQVLEIFRRKTAPAFGVALELGAIVAGGHDPALAALLGEYSDHLGIAYQIRDDLEDLTDGHAPADLAGGRPSLPLAIAWERSKGEARATLERVWRRELPGDVARPLLAELQVEERCRQLLESYKEAAIRCLSDVDNPTLKGLLRRVIGKIFRVEVKGWCREFEARNAAGGSPGAAAAG